jgi:uncharacterized membrane protein YeaQ/YmgE (transglycosylase-associated protein family)
MMSADLSWFSEGQDVYPERKEGQPVWFSFGGNPNLHRVNRLWKISEMFVGRGFRCDIGANSSSGVLTPEDLQPLFPQPVKLVVRYVAQEALMLGGLIWWIVVGLIAGWLAGKVMKGGGFGALMDIVIGIIGAIIGGWVFGRLGGLSLGGMLGTIAVAFVGAVIFLWLVRLIKKA